MRLKKPLLLITATLSLAACQTLDSAFDNVSGAWDSVLDAPTNPTTQRINGDPAAAFSGACPRIHIVKELSALNEFSDPDTPTEDNLISHVEIEQRDSSCTIEDRNVIIDLKLAFNSKLGKQAKIRKNDKPFFAYPFFVAITDIRGTILAKEVFAASMTYNRDQTAHTYYENIRQIIPIAKRSTARSYQVYIGFQLSDEQLAYNRETITPPPEIILEHTADQGAPEILHPTLQTEE